MADQSNTTDEFYVGYLPAPSRTVRFQRIVVPVLLLACGVAGIIAIRNHKSPGTGTWNLEEVIEIEGVVDTQPYAMIRVAATEPSQPFQTILLVSEGKFGARDRAAPYRGQAVRIRGTILSREGRRLVELISADDAIMPLSDAALANLKRPIAGVIESVTLKGEIIDPKCYFGAMKPGEGKAHKECATLCISGGIPPMFLTRNSAGDAQFYLLADQNGNAVGNGILPYVADAVQIPGTVERLGDILVFKIDPQQIQRL